jgi:uncharacterized coiled-coil protein SlyX
VSDEELIAVLDARFAAVDSRFAALDAHLETRFSHLETDIRHANVQIESVRDETKRIAESVILVDEKLERFRTDTAAAFEEMKSITRVSFAGLEKRVTILESKA